MITVMIAAAAQLVSEPASQQKAFNAYFNCIFQRGEQLLPSGEPATTIAAAALTLCDDLVRPAAVEMREASRTLLAHRGITTPSSTDEWIGRLRHEGEKRLVAFIVEEKAKRGPR